MNLKHSAHAARHGVMRDVRRLAEAALRFVEPPWLPSTLCDIQNSMWDIK
ncbi:MAG: hypothetical protein M3R03_00655 [Pseudomonadota bacterium]|nr:hypothetical protein [Pseudomonadota bacterium]